LFKIKVMTVVGTRPEIIRLSETIKKLDKYCNHIFVHTGQNYDYELNQIFFEDLQLRKPDYFLEVKSNTLGEQISKIIEKTEKIILKEKPDAFLVLGDTNSALSAIIAKRYHIPVFHLEAGNRCFDERVPEELNRRIVDHISDVNFCYSENARHYLLKEGLPAGKIFVSGSPMAEVIEVNKEKILNSTILEKLKISKNKYFVVSCHREENVDNKENLLQFYNLIIKLTEKYKYPIVITLHPRTKKRLKKINSKFNEMVILSKPFNFSDYNNLQINAYCVISDSGTIFEEAAILNFPAIVIRESTERPEALDTGSAIQTGLNVENVLNAIELVRNTFSIKKEWSIPDDYKPTNFSDRVVKFIIGQANILKNKEIIKW